MAEFKLSQLGSRERKMLAILGGVVLIVIVYLLFLRGGGGSAPRQLAPTPTGGTPRATASPSAGPSTAPGTSEVFEGKDPFRPLVGEQGGGGGGGTPSPGPSGGPSTGQRITLLDIFKESGTLFATVEVNGTDYKVKEGDTFDGNFRVLSLTEKCGTFVYGDERFTLCIGQEVFK